MGVGNKFEQSVLIERVRIEPTGQGEGFIGLVVTGLRAGERLVSYFFPYRKEEEVRAQLTKRMGGQAKITGHIETTRNRVARVIDDVSDGK